MASDTITQTADAAAVRPPITPSGAARELGLKRGEFDLAVMLGRIRTVGDTGSGQRRVSREEIDRVRGSEGFPESLRKDIRAVGTTEGAKVMGISPARFTRLARVGALTPVKFYLNRYRAVVWLYLAEELRQFAEIAANAGLLTGRMPAALRARLEEGQDLRARNWRGRYADSLLRQAEDPWERAAAMASLLDPVQIAEIIRDPYERAYLNRLKPVPRTHGAPDSPVARIVERITTADDPDEIRWLRSSLLIGLVQARAQRPAPRPAQRPAPQPMPERASLAAEPALPREVVLDASAEEPRGLRKWLRRRRA
ncbi:MULTISPECIES: DUF6397 family protein [unclassified Streptomyces]|uniref:DUF6397 family protein n=1 Tax=unclassified Streptomyces TaxID=2593676 RepID=UPI001CBAF096|nr:MULTISPECIES: DUF6397 family protein [unclassified Streptomyces]WPO75585.1 DUF6397 family protein [Streptomyces sp. KN37]